jgi:hypothetical protein
MNGFDCGYECGSGLGLKQVIEKEYVDVAQSVDQVFPSVVLKATDNNYHYSPTSLGNITENTQRLQARSFVALATYVLEQNGTYPPSLNPPLPLHTVALDSLRNSLVHAETWWMNPDIEEGADDAMKWAEPVSNVARAVDLYLALENAYAYFGDPDYGNASSTTLLSLSEKTQLLTAYHIMLRTMEGYGGEGWEDLGLWLIDFTTGVDAYDVQAGNWPLLVQVALGYAMLTQQNVQQLPGTQMDYPDMVRRAFKAAGRPAGEDRHLYWNYQTADGKRFWAEGPYYFHIVAGQVVPLWHAARINGLLSNADVLGFTLSGDPFFSPWFTTPLEWLADLTTPDGSTPPLDDGRTVQMYNSSVLRWTGSYGSETVGRKFAWINDRMGFSSNANLWPVTLSIPRLDFGQGTEPVLEVGNEFPFQTGEDGEQQVLIRRGSESQHYVLLNGESGAAIGRGEGHEQPDQLQLLYYVGGMAYLMDSGYQKAGHWTLNSPWNYYQDHNVMQMYPFWLAELPERSPTNMSGVIPPFLAPPPFRKESDHQNVTELFRNTDGSVDVLTGSIDLKSVTLGGTWYSQGTYKRHVLFVNDPAEPYLIDLNMAYQPVGGDPNSPETTQFVMSYHGHSPLVSPRASSAGYARWRNIGGSGGDLIIYPGHVERDVYTANSYMNHLDIVGDFNTEGSPKYIRRMDIQSSDGPGDFFAPFHTTAAFIKAFPTGAPANPSMPYQMATGPLNPGERRNAQAWVWPIDANTVDVFVARSGMYYYYDGAITRTDFPVDVALASGTTVTLPAFHDFGFVRLSRDGADWIAAPGYLVNLRAPTVLDASISGPATLGMGETGTWEANVSGGTAPYSYLWEYMIDLGGCEPDLLQGGFHTEEVPQCEWYYGSSGSSFSRSVSADALLSLRLTVTDYGSDVVVATKTVTIGTGGGGGFIAAKQRENAASVDGSPRSAGLESVSIDIPESVVLEENYPNPFNPLTEIRFGLPEELDVSLVVFDILGRQVAELVTGRLSAGYHRARFDAVALPSGTYIYRLIAGTNVRVGRMVVLK